MPFRKRKCVYFFVYVIKMNCVYARKKERSPAIS